MFEVIIFKYIFPIVLMKIDKKKKIHLNKNVCTLIIIIVNIWVMRIEIKIKYNLSYNINE